jgi:predicted kinase
MISCYDLAKILASELGNTVHIQTDTLRSTFPKPSYSREESSFVYDAMYQIAREAPKRGFNAILDATFLRDDYRQEARRKLSRYYSSQVTVNVMCDPLIALERNKMRGDASVPEETLLRFMEMFEEPKRGIKINSSIGTRTSSEAIVLKRLERTLNLT